MKRYLFDMDGTLTASKKNIDKKFGEELLSFFFLEGECSIVTGSNYRNCQDQLGQDILDAAEFLFCCNGSDVYYHSEWVESNYWKPKENLKEFLRTCLIESKFPAHLRTANHLETRIGMLNFSIVGQGATDKVRKQYKTWDDCFYERKKIAQKINENFKTLVASVAGETGIDISSKKHTKAQVLDWYNRPEEILFFGDKTEEGGNDHPLAQKVETITVKSWRDTRKKLIKINKDILDYE